MIKRLGVAAAVFLLLGVLIPAPTSAHTRRWIEKELTITHRWRTRGGTGFAVQGYLEVLNKKPSVRNIECTLQAVRTVTLRADDVAPGETADLSFFMGTWRMRQNPEIVHCHRAPSTDPMAQNGRI
jgi:hypothetical protein